MDARVKPAHDGVNYPSRLLAERHEECRTASGTRIHQPAPSSYDEISIRLPSGSRQYTERSVPRAPCLATGPCSMATPQAFRCATTSCGVAEVRKHRS